MTWNGSVKDLWLTYGFWVRLVGCLLLVAAAIFGTRLFRWLGRTATERLQKYTPKWLHILIEGFHEPFVLMLRASLLFCAVLAAPLPITNAELLKLGEPVLGAAATALIAWGFLRSAPLCRLLLRSAENQLDLETNKTMGRFLENIYRVIVLTFAVLVILDIFGVPVTSLVAGAGIAGLAVSLAAQSTLSNLIAGITLVLERPFGIGDYVQLGGIEGTVEDVSFRSTRLRTPDKVLITVENSKICGEYIQNLTNRNARLWTFTVGVTYDTPREKVDLLCRHLEELLRSDPQVQGDTVQIVLDGFGASSIDLSVRVYVDTPALGDFRMLKHRINLAIMDLMAQDGCEFAFPSQTVYLANSEG